MKKTGVKFLDGYQISLEFAPAWLDCPLFLTFDGIWCVVNMPISSSL